MPRRKTTETRRNLPGAGGSRPDRATAKQAAEDVPKERVALYIGAGLLKRLRLHCVENRTNMSAVVARALESYLR